MRIQSGSIADGNAQKDRRVVVLLLSFRAPWEVGRIGKWGKENHEG